MADDEKWVSVTSVTDPVQVDMWRDLLEQEGIAVQTAGLRHAQAIGGPLTAAIMGVQLRVRASDADRARDLLESLDLGEPIDRDHDPGDSEPPPRLAGTDSAGPYRADARGAGRLVAPKRALVAAGVGLFLSFGSAHFYAGEVASGALLALSEVFSFGLLGSGQSVRGALMLLFVIGIDVWFGTRAVKRANMGTRRTPVGQALGTAMLLLTALGVSYTIARLVALR
jgi:hypothetical protein